MKIGQLTFNQIDNEEFFQDNNLMVLFYYIDSCVGERGKYLKNISLFDVCKDWFDNYLDQEVYEIWKKRLNGEYHDKDR